MSQETTTSISYSEENNSDACHFGRNTCNFVIFYKRESQGIIDQRRFYSTKARRFIISNINLRRRAKIHKGDRVRRNKLSITGVEKFIRKIKLIRITDLLFKGSVKRLNKTNIKRKVRRCHQHTGVERKMHMVLQVNTSNIRD